MQEFNKNISKKFFFNFFIFIFIVGYSGQYTSTPTPPKPNGVLPPMLISCLSKLYYSPFILDMLYQLPDGTITDEIINVVDYDRK